MNHKTYEVKIYDGGNKEWRLNESLHREDGPAVEWANGDKEWYLNGQRHREDGPAIEFRNGHKEWYINGKRHREDGPAYEYSSGDKSWFLNGKKLSEQKFNDRMNNDCEGKVVDIDGIKYKLTKV